MHPVEGRLGDVDVPGLHEGGVHLVEEGQEQGADVGAVHVGIGHDDDLVVAEFLQIERLAVLFGADRHGSDLHVLHAAEWPIMAVEALCLLMIIIALVSGNAAAQAAFAAFTTGMWAQVFWVGAVGIGFLIPLALSFFGSKAFRTGATAFYTSGLAAICGMMCLRLFIIYAGQINSI